MKRFFILIGLTIISVAAVFSQTNLQEAARINLTRTEAITVGQLRTEIDNLARQQLSSQLNRVPTTAEINTAVQNGGIQIRRQVLDQMINNKLVLQAAERDRITVTDNELNQQIEQLKMELAQSAQMSGLPTDAQLAEALGIEQRAMRQEVRQQLIAQKVLIEKKGHLFNNISEPTEAEIANIYSLNRTEFTRPDTVRLSMIEVLVGTDAASRTRSRELINSLYQQISSNPARFNDIVLQSQAPNSGYQAGDFGYLPRTMDAQRQVGADFMNTAFALREGEISGIIETNQSYLIIKVTEILQYKPLELYDIDIYRGGLTVREVIRRTLLQERQSNGLTQATQELVTELRAQASIQITEANLNW